MTTLVDFYVDFTLNSSKKKQKNSRSKKRQKKKRKKTNLLGKKLWSSYIRRSQIWMKKIPLP